MKKKEEEERGRKTCTHLKKMEKIAAKKEEYRKTIKKSQYEKKMEGKPEIFKKCLILWTLLPEQSLYLGKFPFFLYINILNSKKKHKYTQKKLHRFMLYSVHSFKFFIYLKIDELSQW